MHSPALHPPADRLPHAHSHCSARRIPRSSRWAWPHRRAWSVCPAIDTPVAWRSSWWHCSRSAYTTGWLQRGDKKKRVSQPAPKEDYSSTHRNTCWQWSPVWPCHCPAAPPASSWVWHRESVSTHLRYPWHASPAFASIAALPRWWVAAWTRRAYCADYGANGNVPACCYWCASVRFSQSDRLWRNAHVAPISCPSNCSCVPTNRMSCRLPAALAVLQHHQHAEIVASVAMEAVSMRYYYSYHRSCCWCCCCCCYCNRRRRRHRRCRPSSSCRAWMEYWCCRLQDREREGERELRLMIAIQTVISYS